MSYDKVLEHVGDCGLYHRCTFLLLFLVNAYTAFPGVLVVFPLLDIPFRCAVPNLDNDTFHVQDEAHQLLVNASIPYDVATGLYSECFSYKSPDSEYGNATIPCKRWVYDPVLAPSSLVYDLDLVCDRREQKAHYRMVFMIGLLAGSTLAGPTADTFGRKLSMLAFIMVQSVATFVMPFVMSTPVLLFIMFITAMSIIGAFLNSFTLMLEVMSSRKTTWGGLGPLVGWSLGLVLVVPFYYWVVDWRVANYIYSTVGFCFIIYWCITPESPRWLISRHRLDDARRVFQTIAKVNKVTLPEELAMNFLEESQTEMEKSKKRSLLIDLRSLLASKVLFLRIVIISYCWFSVMLVYLGTTYNIGEVIKGNVYVNFVIQALMETLGYVIGYVFMNWVGRRKLMFTFLMISGIAFLLSGLSILLDIGSNWVPMISYAIGKSGVTATFIVIFVLANELMPTVVRNSAVGLCAFIAHLAAIVSPYLAILDRLIPNAFGESLHHLIFSVTTLTSALLMLLLPETKDRKLPDTIEEAENVKGRKYYMEPTAKNIPDDCQPVEDCA